jgi:hypothetical protein
MAHFDLEPASEEALRLTCDLFNEPFQHQMSNGDLVLRVPFLHVSKTPGNLVTFGRETSTSDIYLGDFKFYSKSHCYIYVHTVSEQFVLKDVLPSQTTRLEVDGDERYSLKGDPRRCVIPIGKSATLKINDAIFRFLWARPGWSMKNYVTYTSNQRAVALRTSVGRLRPPPPRCDTIAQSPAPPHDEQILERIAHEPVGADLGDGTFGKVKLTINIHSGCLLAVKQLVFSPENEKLGKENAKREVGIMSELSHVSAQSSSYY